MLRSAIEALSTAVERSPDNHKAHYHLAVANDRLDQPGAADASYRACIELEPRYVACFVGLGQMYVDYGYPDVALEVLKAGAKVNETRASIWSALGSVYRASSKYADAVEAYEKARDLAPDTPGVWFDLGMAYADQRRRKEAIEALLQFLQLADDTVPEHLRRFANSTIARMQDVF